MGLHAPYTSHVSGDATLTMEEAARYIVNYDRWEKYISSETLEKIMPTVKCRDIIGVHYVAAVRNSTGYHPQNDNYYEERCEREEVIPDFRFEEWKGEWRRDVHCPAIGYRIPYTYQTVELNKVWRVCVAIDYPYLKDYKFDAYCPSYNDLIEIYVKLNYVDPDTKEEKVCSVYCPLDALKEKNPDIIVERHTKYHSQYWSSDKEKQKEWINANIPVLSSPAFAEFAEHVRSGK